MSTTATLRIIQFPHPGSEHQPRRPDGRRGRPLDGAMPWYGIDGQHARKFLVSNGSYLTDATSPPTTGPTGFWGEWEGPSDYSAFLPGAGIVEAGHPRYWHTPFLPADAPSEPRRNTDPLVCGPDFIYSNCKQSRAMRELAEGSLILFGSGGNVDGRRGFVLDTCLVIGSREPGWITDEDPSPYGHDTLDDAVLGALASEHRAARTREAVPHTIYRGRGPGHRLDEPFSFVPCLPADPEPQAFRRPVLDLPDLAQWINPRMQQGIKGSAHVATAEAVRRVWTDVRDCVLAQGLCLGVRFDDPPRRPSA